MSWINNLPPACWFTFWKSIFKHQLGCRLDILDSISSFFFYFDICNYICLDTSYHFWLYLYLLNILNFSSTPVLTSSIDMVFVLSIWMHKQIHRIHDTFGIEQKITLLASLIYVARPSTTVCGKASIAVATILVPCHKVKSEQLIGRLDTCKCYLCTPNLQIKSSDLMAMGGWYKNCSHSTVYLVTYSIL